MCAAAEPEKECEPSGAAEIGAAPTAQSSLYFPRFHIQHASL